MEQFKKLGICENVLKVISNKKFTEPSEIQKKTIPLVIKGKDIIAGSATGSGKTLAFGAGLIKDTEKNGGLQSLVLTPTRELAEQITGALKEFSYYKKLEVVSVYGGVSIVNQIKKLAYADIVVATPGRLLDHIKRNSINLSKIKFLVLDEADRMWDMGFKNDVDKIVNRCPKNRQTLLFSATIVGDLSDFANKYMKNPVEISVNNYVDTSKLKQVYYDVRDNEKFSLLVHLLKSGATSLDMIFCNTRRNTDFVAKNLKENGINAHAIHGGMEQNKRIRILKNFSDGKANVIVCTDVAARGLDIQGITHVYNYDLPKDHKDYIHRIGRTARAGSKGIAVNILASRDYDAFSSIQKHNNKMEVKRINTPSFNKVLVKFDQPRGKGLHGRTARGGHEGDKGRFGKRNRNSGNTKRFNNHHSSSGNTRAKVKSGFRGSGRNNRTRRVKQ